LLKFNFICKTFQGIFLPNFARAKDPPRLDFLFPVKKPPFSKKGDKEITDILDDRMFLRYK